MLTAINGKELWLETSGEGDPVVMVHGLGGTSTFFDAVYLISLSCLSLIKSMSAKG